MNPRFCGQRFAAPDLFNLFWHIDCSRMSILLLRSHVWQSPQPLSRRRQTHPIGRIVRAIGRWHGERLRGNFFAAARFGVVSSFRSHAAPYFRFSVLKRS
jgi:hypothetical protein